MTANAAPIAEMVPKLVPCECGGEARILNDFRDLVVLCPSCGQHAGYFKSREDAIAAWNRRPPTGATP